jgi:hypothetical protein
MPTVIPGYVYSLFAALLVGSILIYSCNLAALNIKNQAVSQQLKNIDEYVAAQSLTLLSHTHTDNQNTTQYLDLPAAVGNERYWIRITNDSSGTWVESGFGTNVTENGQRINVYAAVNATGSFVSGSGRPVLQCSFENQLATLTLTSE